MSPEDQKLYDDYFDLFACPGWKQIVEDWKTDIIDLDNLSGIEDLETLYSRRGKVEVLKSLVNLQSTVEYMYNDAKVEELAP